MATELKELMDSLDPSREKIFFLTTKCLEYVSSDPLNVQKLIEIWTKSIETCPYRLPLLFLCNDLIRTQENLRPLFQLSLSRAIYLASVDFNAISDIRKLLKIWGDFQIFPKGILSDWEKICSRGEQAGSITDRRNFSYIISLGKKLKKVKILESKEEKKIEDLYIEYKAREELIREIVSCMKKVFHGQLETSICLGMISSKGNS